MPPPNTSQNKVAGLVTRMPSTTRDKAELRAAMQDSVLEFTTLRRARILPTLREKYPSYTDQQIAEVLDEIQPLYHEYDPVIELAVMGADHRNSPELRRQANAEAAQYTRPKLKSVEFTADPQSLEQQEERRQLAGRLVGLLNAASSAKRDAADVEVEYTRADAPAPPVRET